MTSKPSRRLRSAIAICALLAIPAIVAALAQASTGGSDRSGPRRQLDRLKLRPSVQGDIQRRKAWLIQWRP